MKRITAIFAFIIVISILLMPIAVQADEVGELRFNDDGKFRILVISDPQDVLDPRQETLDFMNAALDEAQPDLVVFTGDNIYGCEKPINKNAEKTELAIRQIMQPVTSRKLPFCLVFGNHDDEGGISKEAQLAIYQTMPNCLAVCGDEQTGCGNYNLIIKAHDSEKAAFNLWFVDSGTYNEDKSKDSFYAFVADDQIEWYKNKSNELRAQNGGEPLPSILFQHMPVTEIFDLLTEVEKGTDGAVEKNGKYYILNQDLASGRLGEAPCPPDYNNGQFSAWVEQGDILAAFFAHDHKNNFSGTLDGIDLVHTAGVGFYDYGDGREHAVRVIDIAEKSQDYETSSLYYKDLVGDKIYGDDYVWTDGARSKGNNSGVIVAICGCAAFGVGIAIGVSIVLKKAKTSNK